MLGRCQSIAGRTAADSARGLFLRSLRLLREVALISRSRFLLQNPGSGRPGPSVGCDRLSSLVSEENPVTVSDEWGLSRLWRSLYLLGKCVWEQLWAGLVWVSAGSQGPWDPAPGFRVLVS